MSQLYSSTLPATLNTWISNEENKRKTTSLQTQSQARAAREYIRFIAINGLKTPIHKILFIVQTWRLIFLFFFISSLSFSLFVIIIVDIVMPHYIETKKICTWRYILNSHLNFHFILFPISVSRSIFFTQNFAVAVVCSFYPILFLALY